MEKLCRHQWMSHLRDFRFNSWGQSPAYAAMNGEVVAVEWLLSNGANVDQTNEIDETALYRSSCLQILNENSLSVIQALLNAGADINSITAHYFGLGRAAIHHLASQCGTGANSEKTSYKILLFFIEKGTSIEIQHFLSVTPL